MARKQRGGAAEPSRAAPSPPLADTLLLTTLCFVGLPVEAQARDGSRYAGVFHTASLRDGFGIVLKKARKIGKGKYDSNVSVGALIDTLVILSSDLVQLVVKDFVFPADGVVGNGPSDGVEVVSRTIAPESSNMDFERELSSLKLVQVAEYKPDRVEYSCYHIDEQSVPNLEVEDANFSNLNNACLPQISTGLETLADMSCKMSADDARCDSLALPHMQCATEIEPQISMNFLSSDFNSSPASTSCASVLNNTLSSYTSQSELSNASVSKGNSLCNMKAKEFKLNAEAKDFTPSFANYRAPPGAMMTLQSPANMSNGLPVMPVSVGHPGTEISSYASNLSLPTKLIQYNSFVAGQNDSVPQHSRPIVAHAGARQQPVRFTGQYHPVQSAPAFAHPNSQSAMAGRFSQLVYVQPMSQDGSQGITVISQGLPQTVLTLYHANVPKLQGTTTQPLQFCMTPPPMMGGNYPFAIPSHIPVAHPFPDSRPIPIPGGNGFFGSKFQ